MSSIKTGYLHSLPDSSTDREELDSYWTPAYCVDNLLGVDNDWPRIINEPACGHGHISRRLKFHGFEVVSSDLRNPPLYGEGGVNFLESTARMDAIITNPPYGMLNEFMAHVVKTATKFALLTRLHGVVSRGRFAILKNVPYIKIAIYTTPIYQIKDGAWKRGSAFTHCWVIGDNTKMGREFTWIDVAKHAPLD